MPLKIMKKEIEVEREVGYKYLQMLSRAETLVPGAGREPIDVLLWDADAVMIHTDVQNDRVVMDGSINCQAIYCQGEETSLRAITAKTSISQAIEIPGVQTGMLGRVQPVVENVEARYENGHMVFMVSIGIHIWVLQLESIEVIDALQDDQGVESRFSEVCLVKLAAEASETAVLTERVELPEALDARATLMDWGSVQLDSCEPDLGGVRVKGRAVIETLIASGLEGKPGVVVKYPIEFDKLIELPEWLSQGACVYPAIRNIRTQLEVGEDGEEGILHIQADVHFEVASNLRECVNVLQDAYATSGRQLQITKKTTGVCTDVQCMSRVEMLRGTVLLEDGSMAVSSIIAVRARPNIAEIEGENSRSKIRGLLDMNILYMAAGSDRPQNASAQMPFEIDVPQMLYPNSSVRLAVVSTDANALMSDRVEMKVGLAVFCEIRKMERLEYVTEIEEGGEMNRKPGYVIYWPQPGEDAWSIGKQYAIPEHAVDAAADNGKIQQGKPLVLRI